jgi:two-component system phosphate regulon sensor histidine kinase PhoR
MAPLDEAPAEEIRRQLAVLRAVIDGMAEGVWITDEAGVVAQHNDALKALLFTAGDLVGRRPSELLHSAELQAAVERACQGAESARLELTLESLRPRMLDVRVSPLGGHLGGSAAVFFDVTELRRLEKIRKDFVGNVSHELRTPITAIRGYAETLQSGAIRDPKAAPAMVDIILRQALRLSELVEDLLELSRLESKEFRVTRNPIVLGKAVRRATEAVRPRAEARGTALAVKVPRRLVVLADSRGLEQVLLNLIENAVKYIPPGGSVGVSARAVGPSVEIAVRDNGPGIEDKHLPRLFERFYRVDKGRSRDMGGTGLGLSIVKHLVTAMGGEVRVESTLGEGSTFFVTLPRPEPRPG